MFSIFYFLDIEYEISSDWIPNPGYKCTHRECPWDNYIKDTEFGFYLENGKNISGTNCETCMIRCDNDPGCSSVECGIDQLLPNDKVVKSHCSWWGRNMCDDGWELTLDQSSNTNYMWTCKKDEGISITYLSRNIRNIAAIHIKVLVISFCIFTCVIQKLLLRLQQHQRLPQPQHLQRLPQQLRPPPHQLRQRLQHSRPQLQVNDYDEL